MQINRSDIDEMDSRFRATLMNCLTGFKSLNLIGTQSRDGNNNLALFSQVIHIGANPPLVGVLFRPHTVIRNTLENILETKSYTLNHVIEEFVQQAHHTSARWEGSEFEECGLTPEFDVSVKAPFVSESNLKIAKT